MAAKNGIMKSIFLFLILASSYHTCSNFRCDKFSDLLVKREPDYASEMKMTNYLEPHPHFTDEKKRCGEGEEIFL